MIKPTIGRVVLVTQRGIPTKKPAFVCMVHNERLINVAGFSEYGSPFAALSIPLLQDDDPIPEYATWYAEWMPYQKTQAAIAENNTISPEHEAELAEITNPNS